MSIFSPHEETLNPRLNIFKRLSFSHKFLDWEVTSVVVWHRRFLHGWPIWNIECISLHHINLAESRFKPKLLAGENGAFGLDIIKASNWLLRKERVTIDYKLIHLQTFQSLCFLVSKNVWSNSLTYCDEQRKKQTDYIPHILQLLTVPNFMQLCQMLDLNMLTGKLQKLTIPACTLIF